MTNFFITIFFLFLMSSVSGQILLLYCSPGQKNVRMKYVEYRPYFYLILRIYFIQADHSAYNYLKISQKKYSRTLNRTTSFYFTTVRMQSVSIPDLACQTRVIVYSFPFSSFGEFIPRLSVGTNAPSNIKAIPLSSLSLPWRSSENIES